MPDNISTAASTTGRPATPPKHVADGIEREEDDPTTDNRTPAGAAGTTARPRLEPLQRGPHDVDLLALVDRVGQPEERLELPDLESVRVGAARDLPQPEQRRVRLPCGRRQAAEEVVLGLHVHHRDVVSSRTGVGRRRTGSARSMPHPGGPSGIAERGAAVDQEPVEERGLRVHAVDVRRERVRRLRLADRQHARRPRATPVQARATWVKMS